MPRTSLAIALLSAALAGCSYGEPEEHVSGPYTVLNAYPGGPARLAYVFDPVQGSSIGRVSETVVAVGADANHVIVKRHPERNWDVTEYYIIDRRLDGPYADRSVCVAGPFDRNRFHLERLARGVSPRLSFSVIIE